MHSAFQFILKLFSVVEVRALRRPHKFFQSDIGKLCLQGPHFVHRRVVMLEYVLVKPLGSSEGKS